MYLTHTKDAELESLHAEHRLSPHADVRCAEHHVLSGR